MFENTILKALQRYHIHLQTKPELSHIKSDSCRLNQIKACEAYIEKGNEITICWMQDNHTVVSKAVKYAHDFIHRNYIKNDSEYLSEEHKELNLCVRFFTEFYEKIEIDSKYMDIDF